MIVTQKSIEEICDSINFPSNATLNSWCRRYEDIDIAHVHHISTQFYNSTALDNLTRSLLHILNGSPDTESTANEDLFWKTLDRVKELSGGDYDYLAIVQRTEESEEPVWLRDPLRLFGQISQLIDFLGPFGPAKGSFSIPSDWYSFASAFGASDLIGGYNDRLLKSYRFGDSDYPGCVNAFLERLSQKSLEDSLSISYKLGYDLVQELKKNHRALMQDARNLHPLVFEFLSDFGLARATEPMPTAIRVDTLALGSESDSTSDATSEAAHEVHDDCILIQRGIELIHNQFHFKVKVTNTSGYVITDVSVALTSYPQDSLEIVSDEVKKNSKIDCDGFWSPLFVLQPTQDCVQGDIVANVTYIDHRGKPHVLLTRPQIIRSVCDLLTPLESTIDDFVKIVSEMKKDSIENKVALNAQLVFRMLKDILPTRNLSIVHCDEKEVGGEFIGEINCLAKGKYTQKKLALKLSIIGRFDGNQSTVKVISGSDDINMLPAALNELSSEIRGLRNDIKTLMAGTIQLMKAAGESIENQEIIRSLVGEAIKKEECNSLLARELMAFVQKKLYAVESGQQELASVIDEIEKHVRYTAEKVLLDKSLFDKFKSEMKWVVSEMAGEGVGAILWNIIKIPLGAYLGTTLP